MILQSLNDLYQRLSEDADNGLPTPGYSLQNINFCVVITDDGTLVSIEPCRTETIEIGKNGKEKKIVRPLSLLVPGQAKPPGQGLNPCFLWDNTGYMLSFKPEDPKKSEAEREKEKARTIASFEAFKKRHLDNEGLIDSPDFSAVCSFLRTWKPESAADHPLLQEITSGFGVFQISGNLKYVHQSPSISRWWTEQSAAGRDGEQGLCLVTGKPAALAQLHDPAIKGVAGAQSSGAKLVSFNLNAFVSLGKEQGLNSPVSEAAAFAYCNALNWLLARKERRFRIGDATTVFWTAEATPAEALLPSMMSGTPDAEDTGTKQRVQEILGKIARGTLGKDGLGDPKVPYFILGLSPNASRLSVRFWHTGRLGELIDNLKLHLNQLELVRQWDETNSKNPEPVHPSSYQLLRQTAREADGIPPLLGGGLMRSILLGTNYPASLVTAVINRIRAERDVGYLKAAILKAWLIRNQRRWLSNNHIRMTTALDKNNSSVAYQLGRLFAVYEQAQRAAHEVKLERTIRETMFSSASANPLSVFGRLDRLNKHHLQKLNAGSNRFFSDLIDEIHQKVRAPGFYPASLDLKNQSLFCIGYYHQRHEFRPNKSAEPATAAESAAA